jgi:hypothetical protein
VYRAAAGLDPLAQVGHRVTAVDTRRQLILAQEAYQGPGTAVRRLPPLLATLPPEVGVQWGLADGEFDAEINHVSIHRILGAQSAIPAFPRGSPRRQRHLRGRYRERMRTAFPRRIYRQRALSETVFSVVPRKLSARAPGRSVATQCRPALLLGLAYDIYRLKPRLVAA